MSLKLSEKEAQNRLKRAASAASVALAAALTLLKVAAAVYTGSLAVLSSMIDSLADIFASSITFVAVKFASMQATDDHRYGFGKAEAISALVQSAFVAGSGIFVLYDGIMRLFMRKTVGDPDFGIVVMVISLAATTALILFQKYVAKRTNSLAIAADSAHYTVDVVTNLAIIATLVVVKLFEIYWFDTVTALAVAGYLLLNAYKLACGAVSVLTDAELSDDIRKKVCRIVMENPFSQGIHDLRTRDLGGAYMFEFHLELDGDLPLSAAHEMTEAVEDNLLDEFPNAQIIIHQDPVGVKEERLDHKLRYRRKKGK
mgnify:FL=1